MWKHYTKPIVNEDVRKPIAQIEYLNPILQVNYPDRTMKTQPYDKKTSIRIQRNFANKYSFNTTSALKIISTFIIHSIIIIILNLIAH